MSRENGSIEPADPGMTQRDSDMLDLSTGSRVDSPHERNEDGPLQAPEQARESQRTGALNGSAMAGTKDLTSDESTAADGLRDACTAIRQREVAEVWPVSQGSSSSRAGDETTSVPVAFQSRTNQKAGDEVSHPRGSDLGSGLGYDRSDGGGAGIQATYHPRRDSGGTATQVTASVDDLL